MHKCTWEGCNYETKNTSSLKSHIFVHTGEKPFKCDFKDCDWSGTCQGNLDKHKLVHTGERPRKCDVCKQTFARSGTLINHRRTHFDEKPIKCKVEDCGFTTKSYSSLKSHTHFFHTEKGQQERKREEVKIEKILPEGSFKREHQVDYRCIDPKMSFSRLDFLLPYWKKGGHVIIEVDEGQHSHISQSCETTRMNNVVTSWMLEGSDTPVVWIRYNPHTYKIDGKKQTMTHEERQKQLLNFLDDIEFDNQPQVRVYYMFYDTDGGVPRVLDDPEYQETVKSWVFT